MTSISRLRCFFFFVHRNSGLSPVACQQSSCTFQALPRLEEYNISVVVKDQLGEETASYCFNISDRGQRSFKRRTADVLRNVFLCVLATCTIKCVFIWFAVSGSCCEVAQGGSWSDNSQPVLDHSGEPDQGHPPLPGHHRSRQHL